MRVTLSDLYGSDQEIFWLMEMGDGGGATNPKPELPWKKFNLDINLNHADTLLFSLYGDREVSPTLSRLMPVNADINHREVTAYFVLSVLYDKWTRMSEIAAAQYDPIGNYDMKETETEQLTDGGEDVHTVASTDTDIIDYGRTDTSSSDLTHGESISTSGSSDIYGFDSISGARANSDIGSEAHSGTDRTQYQGAAGGKDERTLTRSDNESTQYGKTQNKTRTLTRSGNIGVTTSTQMLEQGVAFWQWTLYDQIVRDVGELITSPIYM